MIEALRPRARTNDASGTTEASESAGPTPSAKPASPDLGGAFGKTTLEKARPASSHPLAGLIQSFGMRSRAAAASVLGAFFGRIEEHRDPLAGQKPLYDASELVRTPTKYSIGNAAYSSSGELFASIQTAGRGQDAPPFHLAKVNRQTGELTAYPSPAFQKDTGALLGLRVIPKPKAVPGKGELLVGLDWKNSQLVAIDLDKNEEIFRGALPEPFLSKLPPLKGGLSFHNDFAAVFDDNPNGTFHITNPPRGSIGVYKPNWSNPAASSFEEILRGHDSTKSGKTDIEIRGERVKLELFKVLGRELEVPFHSGVDSIAYAPDLQGGGPHLLVSALTPKGQGRLWAIPAEIGDAKDIGRAVEDAVRQGRIRAVANVPINDGLHVVSMKGRSLLFGADVEGGGAFVMDLASGKVAPLVRDPSRVGWADGMTSLDVKDDRVLLTFSNSGLESSLKGDAPRAEERGLYTLTVHADELLARLG